MAKILVVVMNGVSFDPRVRRQVATLRTAGHDVHVIGRRDRHFREPFEVWENGVTIERLEPTPPIPSARFVLKCVKRSVKAPPVIDVTNGSAAPPSRAVVGNELGGMSRWAFALSHASRSFQILRRLRLAQRSEKVIARRVQAHQPDLIHAHDIPALPIGALAARRAGVPLIFDAHEIYDQVGGTTYKDEARRRMIAHTIARFTADVSGFVTINESIAGYYARHYAAIPPATVVGNATSAAPSEAYDGRLHGALGVPRDRRILLYQGGFAERRNLVEVLTSAEFLDDRWLLVFMGWGPLQNELEAARSRLSPAGRARIRLLDRVPHDELMRWTSGATLGIIPYAKDNLNHWFCTPNKLWEFPQAGVPILVSPFPEMRRRIETFGHGWLLADPFDPRHMAELVNSLDDVALARAREGCARFNAADNWEIYERRLLALYDRLLGIHPRTEASAVAA